MKKNGGFSKQDGLSLVEILSSLVIAAVVVGGALALYTSGSSSQQTTQMLSDINGIRAGMKQLYFGQGGYGTANVNGTLKAAKKIPTTMSVDNATPPVISHSLNGTLTVTGTGATFTIAITNIPTDICTALLSQSTSWESIQVGAATAITSFPISPATASNATNCGASDANTITFTGS